MENHNRIQVFDTLPHFTEESHEIRHSQSLIQYTISHQTPEKVRQPNKLYIVKATDNLIKYQLQNHFKRFAYTIGNL